ncbi:dienelactone hydrolase family protein [Arthrobacter glacialis]|uniref:dienelactone hydrolase family protein n=1 Tax=Arthrobacter glacialis TaxID=1664 RepID=UPI00105739AD|nr:dienelactone hydrolase family protein [Arthrobacter glacialis]
MTEAGAGAKWPPDHWQEHSFPHMDHAHAFYVIDHGRAEFELPSVMLMHEFPGIKRNLVPLVDTLSQDFRVVVPSILGRDGDPKGLQSLKQICVRREVHVMARHAVSADVGWLRDFADEHVARRRNDPYGVIGMCFSGNFALALAVDPRVAAAVMAQPAIPVWPCALGLSRKDRETLNDRIDLRVHGYRYRRDCMSPAAKLAAAQRLLGGERMQTFPLSGSEGRKHSTLTGPSASGEAMAGVRSFLRERLVAAP